MLRESGQKVRVAMAACRDRAGSRLPDTSLVLQLEREGRQGAPDGGSAVPAVGDARRMLRHLGIDLRRLSPAARRMLVDAEQLCSRCPCSARCGAFLQNACTQGKPPAFCPNTLLFRHLGETLEGTSDSAQAVCSGERSSTQPSMRQLPSGCFSMG